MTILRILVQALEDIADREHIPGCVCYCGDNGYCCGSEIAEEALKSFKENTYDPLL